MAKILRLILLWPLALVYQSIIFIRNRLFDWGIFRSATFSVRVICIGNLEMGGSGKTPTADFIIRHFSETYPMAYLSRGYKRRSKGFVLAHSSSTVADLGDEAFLIFQKWKGKIWLAVDSDRKRGIRRLMEVNPEIKFILLDDGMQHRWVKPSFLIQLTPFVKPFFRNMVFPFGKLRDHQQETKRADAILFTKAPFANDTLLELAKKDYQKAGFSPKPCFISSMHYGQAVNRNGEILPPESTVIAVAGLASNLSFFDWAEKQFAVKKAISKPDHYRYLPTFFEHNQLQNQTILTTEKDFHKLLALAPDPDLIYFIPIELEVFPSGLFLNTIENQL